MYNVSEKIGESENMDYSLLSSEELLFLAQKRDGLAEEELAKRFSYIAKIVSRQFFLTSCEPEDLMQEAMIALIYAIRSYSSVQNSASFSTFANKCIKNRLIDFVRRSGNKELLYSEDLDIEEESGQSLEEFYIEKENYFERLSSYKQRLSKFEYTVLLEFLKGETYTMIADSQHKSVSSIYNAMQRIRTKLS